MSLDTFLVISFVMFLINLFLLGVNSNSFVEFLVMLVVRTISFEVFLFIIAMLIKLFNWVFNT